MQVGYSLEEFVRRTIQGHTSGRVLGRDWAEPDRIPVQAGECAKETGARLYKTTMQAAEGPKKVQRKPMREGHISRRMPKSGRARDHTERP